MKALPRVSAFTLVLVACLALPAWDASASVPDARLERWLVEPGGASGGIALLRTEPGRARWDDAIERDLRAGLERLPRELRAFPGGPLFLELHPEGMPFGAGDGSRNRPEWTGGREIFHLYSQAPLPPRERRARLAVERLPEEVRASLWRQRAIVHAVLARWDAEARWSDRRSWRRLSGWLSAFERPFTWSERPLNLYPGAFSRTRGSASAALDLLTFAEELFVPIEALAPDAVSPDDRIHCVEPSRVEVMQRLLAEAGMALTDERGPCPAFDRWAQLEDLSHLEVLLVAASGRRPESLFGHLLLRPVWNESRRVRGPSFETGVQVVALTDEGAGFGHIARGIFGGYSLTVVTLGFGDLSREVLEHEQRSMRRFPLQLTREQERRVLARIWEAERRGYFDYQFFTDNCATALAYLIEAALDEDVRIRFPGAFIVSPTSALDALAKTRHRLRAPDGSEREVSLIRHLPEDIESTLETAERAEAKRYASESEILAALGDEGTMRGLFAAAHAPEIDRRRRAYDSLAALTPDTLAAGAPSQALFSWWADSARVERYEHDRAQRVLTELDVSLISRGAVARPDLQSEIRERQRAFERESALAQRTMIVDRAEFQRQQIADLPRRRPTSDELKQEVAAKRAVSLFHEVTSRQGALVGEHFDGEDPYAWLEADRQARGEHQARLSAEALTSSGCWRLALGGGAVRSGARWTPTIRLHSMALTELLGDQRIRGFQPTSELHVLEGDAQWTVTPGELPTLRNGRFILFGYRSLRRESPIFRDSFLDAFGWGGQLSADSRPDRRLAHRSLAYAELLAILDSNERFTRLTTVGVGLAGQVRFGGLAAAVGGGPRLSLTQRVPLPGPAANALRFEASYLAGYLTGGGIEQEGGAALSIDVLLGRPDGFGLVLRPRVAWDTLREPGSRTRGALTTELLVEIL